MDVADSANKSDAIIIRMMEDIEREIEVKFAIRNTQYKLIHISPYFGILLFIYSEIFMHFLNIGGNINRLHYFGPAAPMHCTTAAACNYLTLTCEKKLENLRQICHFLLASLARLKYRSLWICMCSPPPNEIMVTPLINIWYFLQKILHKFVY